jgi:hypothetical protein
MVEEEEEEEKDLEGVWMPFSSRKVVPGAS